MRFFGLIEGLSTLIGPSRIFFMIKAFFTKLLLHILLNKTGVTERDNRTIVECVRTTLHSSGFPLSFTGEATNIVVYILNQTGSRVFPGTTPFERWFGFKPSVEHLKILACESYVHVPKILRSKLDPKSVLCFFIGYCPISKAYKVETPMTDNDPITDK